LFDPVKALFDWIVVRGVGREVDEVYSGFIASLFDALMLVIIK